MNGSSKPKSNAAIWWRHKTATPIPGREEMKMRKNYVSKMTGEVQHSVGGVLRAILLNMIKVHIFDFRWKLER